MGIKKIKVDQSGLSPFGKFHFKYRGKNILKRGRIIPKYHVYFNYHMRGIDVDSFFTIEDKPGWVGGVITHSALAGDYFKFGESALLQHQKLAQDWKRLKNIEY